MPTQAEVKGDLLCVYAYNIYPLLKVPIFSWVPHAPTDMLGMYRKHRFSTSSASGSILPGSTAKLKCREAQDALRVFTVTTQK